MKSPDIEDPLFRKGVEAIEAGDAIVLKTLLTLNSELIAKRLNYQEGGYFKEPYLLWFVADNPIRTGKLSANIVDITRLLIQFVKENDLQNAQNQLDYTLELVISGRTTRACGVQIEMIDVLLDAGASLNGIMGAITNGNLDAARHLIKRGAKLTLTGAVALDQMENVMDLAKTATNDEKLTALTVAAFHGNADIIGYLLSIGVNPNGFPEGNSGFHVHATPLHQAVSSGSLPAVKLLAEAGADLNVKDKLFDGTPSDWAEYMQRQDGADDKAKTNLALIFDYLQEERRKG
jgi:peptide-methionine (S)-S-oxide reductase